MRLPGAHAENPVDNFRKVYWGNSPSYARGTAGKSRRMMWQKWQSVRAKKEAQPKLDFFRRPMDTLAGGAPKRPGQATHLHSSANVRQCQGRKETFSLRAGMMALIAATPASRGLRHPASISAK